MGRTDSRAGEHRHRQLGNHAHVDPHPVTALDTEPSQGVGEAAHLLEELRVREAARVPRLALPEVRDLVAAPGFDMAVEALLARVQRAADEPARKGEVPFQDRVPWA